MRYLHNRRAAQRALRVPGAAEDTGAALGLALFAYMLGVTLIVTLMPFKFSVPQGARIVYTGEPVDMIANVLLFVPLGFFWRIARPRTRSVLHVLALGAMLSTAIETIQVFEAMRTPSPVDVMTNAAGAWIGALAAARATRTVAVAGRLVGWLALQLPLMGLVYLLVPLLWIDAISVWHERARMVLAPLLGLFGAVLLGGMQRHYFAPAVGARAQRTALFAALWFIAGAFPALAGRPLSVMLGAALAAVACFAYGAPRVSASAENRRFEVPLLKIAAPVYALYLALIVLLPLRGARGAWSMHIGFAAATSYQPEILRLLEVVAAVTLAGYMAAEFRGRAVLHYRDAVPRLLAGGAALAVAIEALWGFRAGQGASIARAALTVAAALYGGWLYYLQRAHVVRLLAERPDDPGR